MRGLACGLILMATTAAIAQQTQSVSVVVPVVASTIGPFDTHWKTDVVLQNDLRKEATVALSLPSAPDQPAILLTIPAGHAQRFTDVVGEAFGLDNVLSPLVIQTLGTRSVRVVATAYAMQGDKALAPQPVPVTDAASFHPLRVLGPISWSDTRRTNIGLVNLGERDAVFSIALRGPNDEIMGGSRWVIPPSGITHLAIQLIFPAMKNGDNYSVLIETAARDTYVYASVIDNKTNEASFVVPRLGTR